MLGKKLIQAASGAGGLGIESLFSTWLYTGNSSTQTITNGIDLSGKGGMVWTKNRGPNTYNHFLIDTNRGAGKTLSSNTNTIESTDINTISTFNSDGYALGNSALNASTDTYASWTFRKVPGFFDVVTYTGTGSNTTVAHNLGSVPGTIIVKRTDTTGDWQVYHRSIANTEYLVLNSTAAKATGTTRWNSTTPTSSVFSLGTDATVNASGGTYVAYVFAHDEQIFGNAGDQSVIKCGSYTGNGTTQEINLGWEPQWLLVKNSSSVTDWILYDTMRGFQGQDTTPASDSKGLFPNLGDIEDNRYRVHVTATGIKITSESNLLVNQSGQNYIYIAIRRGPMKTPTSGTEVFDTVARSVTSPNLFSTALSYVDLIIDQGRSGQPALAQTRISGDGYLRTSDTNAEQPVGINPFDYNGKVYPASWGGLGTSEINWMFRRAPGFFDVVAYTGTGAARTVPHNLGVVPELMIVKRRESASAWMVYSSSVGIDYRLQLHLSDPQYSGSTNFWNATTPTSAVFSLGAEATVNASGGTYIAYLFATLPGISKCFSYTGNGTSQTINCGFTSGARFVLVKRTDSAGNWLVADTARGIVSGNDPLLYLNSTTAEITTLDWIDPDSSGFIINQEATANANVNGATYIGLAIS